MFIVSIIRVVPMPRDQLLPRLVNIKTYFEIKKPAVYRLTVCILAFLS